MVTLKKAYHSDISRLVPLLEYFGKDIFSEEQCKILFAPTLLDEDGSHGYLLETEEKKAVGYLGYAFSHRIIDEKEYRFCNIHTWIVNEEYRASSLSMLLPILKRKDITITNFSATPRVRELCKKLGFKTFDGTVRILPISHAILSFKNKSRARFISKPFKIAEHLSAEMNRYMSDHSLPHHRHALIQTEEGSCYAMMNYSLKKIGPAKLPFLRIHYLSNAEIFTEHAFDFLLKIGIAERAVGLLISEFLLRGNNIPFSFSREPMTNLYRPAENVTAEIIDGMYTEMSQMNY